MKLWLARTGSESAFTLVELMIVVAIVGLLIAIALPSFIWPRENARLNTIYRNLRTLDGAKEQWALDNRQASGTVIADVSVLSNYFRFGQIHDVIHEHYVPNPVGTPPQADLPNNVRLGPYGPGASIPAP